jgi:hypothetical protein
MDKVTFSNPRTNAMIEDWPIGRQRCRARFEVEQKHGKGERVARYTENKARTGWNRPKRTTYADRFVIVDGDDGRTYLLADNRTYHAVTVWLGDMQHTSETVYACEDGARWRDLITLIGLPDTRAIEQATERDRDDASLEELEAASDILDQTTGAK